MFRFQTGSIKRATPYILKRETHYSFDSKLVRLKDIIDPSDTQPIDSFDSKLVRLKVACRETYTGAA